MRLVWQESTVAGRGVRLHVRRVVEPPAPPVLLLHGLGVAGSVWQAFARRLLPRLAAVAPDLRGHGQSDAPPEGYLPPEYAADLAELMAELHLETPLPVVGHSLGALVALALADLHPDRVRWLALLDPPLDAQLENPEVAQVYRLRQAPPGELEAYLLERNPGGGRLLAEALARLFRQAADAAFEAMLEPTQRRGRAPEAAELAWHAVARIQQPVLVLQADPAHGGVLGDAAARRLTEHLARGTLRKIQGASHSLHASHPAETAQAIVAFAASVDGSR